MIQYETTLPMRANMLGKASPHMMQTATGRHVNALALTPADIDIKDIAISLSNICRFGGHCHFMSVAEHSVRVAQLVSDERWPVDVVVAALFHDGHEAYFGDVIAPLKRHRHYKFMYRWAAKADKAIAAHIGIDPALFHHPAVKAADLAAVKRELEYRAGTWQPEKAARMFWLSWRALNLRMGAQR